MYWVSVVYTGLFKIYDDKNNVSSLNQQVNIAPNIILDPSTPKETAIVTRKPISEQAPVIKPSSIKDFQNRFGNKK